MNTTAQRFHDLGFKVAPTRATQKANLGDKTREETLEMFNGREQTVFAVCDEHTRIVCFDCDTPEAETFCAENGLTNTFWTQREGSPFHHYYWRVRDVDDYPQEMRDFAGVPGLELKAKFTTALHGKHPDKDGNVTTGGERIEETFGAVARLITEHARKPVASVPSNRSPAPCAIETAWAALAGPALSFDATGEARTPCIVHGGQDANCVVRRDTDTWYCHSQCNDGGGVLELVQRVLGLADHKAAAKWLDGKLTREEKLLAKYGDDNGDLHADIKSMHIEPVKFDVETLIEAESPGLLTGPPESLKSALAMLTAYTVATKGKLFDRFAVGTDRSYVVYINLDAGRKAMLRRMQRTGPTGASNFELCTWDAWDWDRFEAKLLRHHGCYFVVDCFSSMFVNGETRVDPAEQMRVFADRLKQLCEKHAASGQVIDHTPKAHNRENFADAFFGSVQKKAAFRQGMTMVRLDDEEADGAVRVVIGCLKMSEAERFAPFVVEFIFGDSMGARYLGLKSEYEATKQDVKRNEDVRRTQDAIAELQRRKEPANRESIQALTGIKDKNRQLDVLKDRSFTGSGATNKRVYVVRGDSDAF